MEITTRKENISEYRKAFQNGSEGERLLEVMKHLEELNCSDEDKALCLKEEIDDILCAYNWKD